MVRKGHVHVVQVQEPWELKPIVAADEQGDVYIDGTVLVLEQEQEQDCHGHDHEQAGVEAERPVAGQDGQEGSDIEEEQVQIQVQGALQSDDAWGCLESAGPVRPVEPEPDAMQRYLEGSGP